MTISTDWRHHARFRYASCRSQARPLRRGRIPAVHARLAFVAGIATRRQGQHRLGGWLIAAGAITLVLFGIYGASFDEATTADNEGLAGLAQRAWFTWIFLWFTVLGLLRR